MWRLQGNGVIFVCCVSVKLRLVFTAGPYWQVVSARCTVWIFIDLWNLRPRNACSLSFLRPALKICVKNADFCVNANPGHASEWRFVTFLQTNRQTDGCRQWRYPSGLKGQGVKTGTNSLSTEWSDLFPGKKEQNCSQPHDFLDASIH